LEKHRKGHRGFVLDLVKSRGEKSRKFAFDSVCPKDGRINVLELIIRYARHNKQPDHCHIMTLDDCIYDFQDKELSARLKKMNISLSATLYGFPAVQMKRNIVYYLKNCFSGYPSEQSIIYNLLRTGLLRQLFLPDERLANPLLYPKFRRKLHYLPDCSRLTPSSGAGDLPAKQKAGLDNNFTFLMFGTMHSYKGLDILVRAVVKGCFNPNKRVNVVLAGKMDKPSKKLQLPKNISLTVIDQYIDDGLASILFEAADCVIMPFQKGFRVSSGTFAIACNFGKPVIVNDGGVLAWRVRKYRNGYVFRSGSHHSLARAMHKMLSADHAAFGANSYKYAPYCSPDHYIGRFELGLEAALDAGQCPD